MNYEEIDREYKDNLPILMEIKERIDEEEKIEKYEDFIFQQDINKTLLHQLKDDVGALVKQLQLLTQRIDRIEDSTKMLLQKELK